MSVWKVIVIFKFLKKDNFVMKSTLFFGNAKDCIKFKAKPLMKLNTSPEL